MLTESEVAWRPLLSWREGLSKPLSCATVNMCPNPCAVTHPTAVIQATGGHISRGDQALPGVLFGLCCPKADCLSCLGGCMKIDVRMWARAWDSGWRWGKGGQGCIIIIIIIKVPT